MKLNLVVLTPGKWEGKIIPITLSQFVIGRDPQCNLRPASAVISKRHCAVQIRGNQVFVRDFDSTNGTFVNSEKIQGERELHDQDRLNVGPLLFLVQIEVAAPVAVDKPTPMPPTKAAAANVEDDDVAAALLLSLQDDSSPPPGSSSVDSQGVPTGSTVMETITTPPPGETNGAPEEAKGGAAREKAAKAAAADTSVAAKAILEKYLRRPRT
jgi:pSer/pThr/pTyr-binding forkhead associated (FHA) protein